MAQGLSDLSAALALRLRDLTRLLDRLDRLESGTGEWLTTHTPADMQDAALDMTLRALRVAADPTNFSILVYLAANSTATLPALEEASGLKRLALNERVNDLIQVGLAARNIDTDQTQLTAGGAALVALIESIGAATAEKLAEAMRPTTH
jgi:hypothetical protein